MVIRNPEKNLPTPEIHFVTTGGALTGALGENDSVTQVFHPDGRS